MLGLKIFESQLVPILLYGGEVWGPYLNHDFSTWEKSEIEKTHTQFLKRILGCHIHTSNIMARSEVGRRPLLCQIVGNSLNFIKHIRSNPESLAYHALEHGVLIYMERKAFYFAFFGCRRLHSAFYNAPFNYLQLLTSVLTRW